jgi:hypothetical protein
LDTAASPSYDTSLPLYWNIPNIKLLGFISEDGIVVKGVVGLKNRRIKYYEMDPGTK